MGMEILHNNKWICMPKTEDNYFTINGLGEIKFPKKFRVTSISGEQLEATLPGIQNDQSIPSGIQYSGFKPGMTAVNKLYSMKENMFVVVAISYMDFAGNTPDGTVKLEM